MQTLFLSLRNQIWCLDFGKPLLVDTENQHEPRNGFLWALALQCEAVPCQSTEDAQPQSCRLRRTQHSHQQRLKVRGSPWLTEPPTAGYGKTMD